MKIGYNHFLLTHKKGARAEIEIMKLNLVDTCGVIL